MNRCRWVAAQGESLRRSRVWLYFPPSGDVAQLGERGVRNAEVEGSIPFVSTTPSGPPLPRRARCAQLGKLAPTPQPPTRWSERFRAAAMRAADFRVNSSQTSTYFLDKDFLYRDARCPLRLRIVACRAASLATSAGSLPAPSASFLARSCSPSAPRSRSAFRALENIVLSSSSTWC